MTADTFAFLLSTAFLCAVLRGWLTFRKSPPPKELDEDWYDPTYYKNKP